MPKLTLHLFIAILFILAGCESQTPDYLKLVSPDELKQAMQAGDVFLVDVHTPEQKHIKGTDLFVPYNQVEKYQDKLPADKNAAIYLYCEGGPMATTAAKSLYQLGYRNLISLEGGAYAWRKQGLPFD